MTVRSLITEFCPFSTVKLNSSMRHGQTSENICWALPWKIHWSNNEVVRCDSVHRPKPMLDITFILLYAFIHLQPQSDVFYILFLVSRPSRMLMFKPFPIYVACAFFNCMRSLLLTKQIDSLCGKHQNGCFPM